MYRGRWQAAPQVSHILYCHGPLTAALQLEYEKPPCGLQAQYECAQDDLAATLEAKHSQTGLMYDIRKKCQVP
jgi:hypothetical protein